MRTDSGSETKTIVPALAGALFLGVVAWLWTTASSPVELAAGPDDAAAQDASPGEGTIDLHSLVTGRDNRLVGDPEPAIVEAVSELGPQRALEVVDEALEGAEGGGPLRSDRAATALEYIAEDLPERPADAVRLAASILRSGRADRDVAFARDRIRSAEHALQAVAG